MLEGEIWKSNGILRKNPSNYLVNMTLLLAGNNSLISFGFIPISPYSLQQCCDPEYRDSFSSILLKIQTFVGFWREEVDSFINITGKVPTFLPVTHCSLQAFYGEQKIISG